MVSDMFPDRSIDARTRYDIVHQITAKDLRPESRLCHAVKRAHAFLVLVVDVADVSSNTKSARVQRQVGLDLTQSPESLFAEREKDGPQKADQCEEWRSGGAGGLDDQRHLTEHPRCFDEELDDAVEGIPCIPRCSADGAPVFWLKVRSGKAFPGITFLSVYLVQWGRQHGGLLMYGNIGSDRTVEARQGAVPSMRYISKCVLILERNRGNSFSLEYASDEYLARKQGAGKDLPPPSQGRG